MLVIHVSRHFTFALLIDVQSSFSHSESMSLISVIDGTSVILFFPIKKAKHIFIMTSSQHLQRVASLLVAYAHGPSVFV